MNNYVNGSFNFLCLINVAPPRNSYSPVKDAALPVQLRRCRFWRDDEKFELGQIVTVALCPSRRLEASRRHPFRFPATNPSYYTGKSTTSHVILSNT